MNILEEIISYKKLEVNQLQNFKSIEEQKKDALKCNRDALCFYSTLLAKANKKEIGLIAEIKKASPSKGIIKKDFNHIEIANSYKAGGASCLSVLTDKKYFQGNKDYIYEIKNIPKWDLPILRKDFIIDKYQLYESINIGANCILLIVAALQKDSLKTLFEIAGENALDVLIEVHNEEEMEIALEIMENTKDRLLLGINNRDLKTFEVNLNTSKTLVKNYSNDLKNKIVISESGILSNDDIKDLTTYGIYSFLVGESLIKENNIKEATLKLLNL